MAELLQGTAREYVDRLGNQVHPMSETLFSNNDAVFQDDNAPQSHSWNCSVVILRTQSPDFNFTEPFWSVLETRVRNRFPSPTSLKQLENVLQEEWYKIPLETVQNLYEFIPSRIAAVLKQKGGPTPY
jgi:hypothetical protein